MYIALNASAKLTGIVGVGVTTVPVTAGKGADFAVGSNHSYVTFQDATNKETCKITGQSGDNLTVVRTKALSWAIGTVIECRPCAEAMADYAVAPQVVGSGAAAIADADTIPFVDVSASSVLAKITWANIKATLKTYFDTLYATAASVAAEIGSTIQGYDAATLKANATKTLTAGYSATPYDAGTKSTGTFTPDEANGCMQKYINGGAHTLAPPTNNTTIILQITNNASAGAITTTGFSKVTGVTPTTANGDDFFAYITKLNGFSHLSWQALQ